MIYVTGVDIIGVLLLHPEPVQGVAADDIRDDVLPPGISLPALLLRTVSQVDHQTPLVRQADNRVLERVSIAVRAEDRPERAQIIGRIMARCAGFIGDVLVDDHLVSGVSVHAAGIGPSLSGPGDTYEQTIDFRVSFPTSV